MQQEYHREWHDQWARFNDDASLLFFDWLKPRTLADFRNKTVLDAGCGPGHHIRHIAPVAKHVWGIDLNTPDIAQERLSDLDNVSILQGDIAHYQPEILYDVVYCIGVIHHTDNPDATFENLKKCVQPGGLLIIWCYSYEGNMLVRKIVEPLRRRVFRHLPRRVLEALAWILTALMYPVIYTVYLLPLTFMPFYEYFQNFRKLSFRRNLLNVFDKLNAPQTRFITHAQIEGWFNPNDFRDVAICRYKGVSWHGSGIVKAPTQLGD